MGKKCKIYRKSVNFTGWSVNFIERSVNFTGKHIYKKMCKLKKKISVFVALIYVRFCKKVTKYFCNLESRIFTTN